MLISLHNRALVVVTHLISVLALTAFFAVTNAMAASSDAYIISVGDELEFDVLDDNDPPQRFIVGRDGSVQFPLIGGVTVGSMTLGNARLFIHKAYVDKQIFVNPQIELSIANFRPISVLGDVKNPGNFDYQPQMTAEQAVGMAGGPSISANNEEARVLERRSLEGALDSLKFEMALLAAQYARAQAQLNGDNSVVWADVPPKIRSAISREIFDEHRIEEDRIIALESHDIETRRKLLTDSVAEALTRISLLTERKAVSQSIVDQTNEEAKRVVNLAERGLVPSSQVSGKQLEVSQAESQVLQMREQISAAKVQLADLQGQLSRFDTNTEEQLLSQKQVSLSEINKAMSRRASLEDRMRLIQQWMNAASGMETELLLEFQVRRRIGGHTDNIIVEPFDELLPGDLLVILVKTPEALSEKL
ncbi:polysaccharide biosynthesis/export family protein [Falsihalocynthiibacter sp. S25ZX9]|uniref:polysaccharide biosynthesis/export family protein n=1 Tax=Falsihalocynthiibacter sp. S25ZX9 TaxID=3240870 RepID=UPI00350F7897